MRHEVQGRLGRVWLIVGFVVLVSISAACGGDSTAPESTSDLPPEGAVTTTTVETPTSTGQLPEATVATTVVENGCARPLASPGEYEGVNVFGEIENPYWMVVPESCADTVPAPLDLHLATGLGDHNQFLNGWLLGCSVDLGDVPVVIVSESRTARPGASPSGVEVFDPVVADWSEAIDLGTGFFDFECYPPHRFGHDCWNLVPAHRCCCDLETWLGGQRDLVGSAAGFGHLDFDLHQDGCGGIVQVGVDEAGESEAAPERGDTVGDVGDINQSQLATVTERLNDKLSLLRARLVPVRPLPLMPTPDDAARLWRESLDFRPVTAALPTSAPSVRPRPLRL